MKGLEGTKGPRIWVFCVSDNRHSFNNEKLTLKELIIRYKDLYLENKIEHNYEIYQLPEQYEFIKSKNYYMKMD